MPKWVRNLGSGQCQRVSIEIEILKVNLHRWSGGDHQTSPMALLPGSRDKRYMSGVSAWSFQPGRSYTSR